MQFDFSEVNVAAIGERLWGLWYHGLFNLRRSLLTCLFIEQRREQGGYTNWTQAEGSSRPIGLSD